MLEFMMNALRLVDGFTPRLFEARTGLGLGGSVASAIADAETRGLLERSSARIRPTAMGLQFLNDLVGLFMADGGCSAGAGGG